MRTLIAHWPNGDTSPANEPGALGLALLAGAVITAHDVDTPTVDTYAEHTAATIYGGARAH